jgi:hypothetical protein
MLETLPIPGAKLELRSGARVGNVAVPLGDTDPYYELGSYHRAVDTPSAQAQSGFGRGMVWA